MSKVLIADDHPVVRAGYKQFLVEEPSIMEVGEAASGKETLAMLRKTEWDLLLMDIHMPDRSGLDILKHVRSGYPGLLVLVISGLPEEMYARNVLRAGAAGYLSKNGEPQELLLAVRTVLRGKKYVSAALAEAMANDLGSSHDPNKALHESLTAREFQIFAKIAAGAGITGIAAELSLSSKTVSTYRGRILEKMGFASNADMTSYALRTGLIQ